MARLHFVKKARKDNPAVKKGESYYWWQFAFGPKLYSATRPARSRLTQSEYLATIWDIQDGVPGDDEELIDYLEQAKADVEQLEIDTQERLDNMPEQLQYSPSGEMLQERIDACSGTLSMLEAIDPESEDLRSEIEDALGGLDV